uniref:ATP synthase complex subunit 8 n=1 Tax=Longitarsus nigrofasciatus TaxID=1425583 RepID=A0A1P8NMX1_9CUCU|nr:ATP synthase F0 subunit 8 [Longitarsus nigrofasciatus]
MPQMMPLNWLTLMIFFILMFYFFNNINFYNFMYLPSKKVIMKIKISSNWKW